MQTLKATQMQPRRDVSIDLLRVIGLLGIMMAHVSPPAAVLQARNFDVVLMVFLSGISFALSRGGKNGQYFAYVWARFKRLIVPAWIFLSVYFALFHLLGVSHSVKDYLYSYGLAGGIGYVWVIRVYFLMAMMAPFGWKLCNKLGMKWYFVVWISVFVMYEAAYCVFGMPDNIVGQLFELVIPYGIGYGLIFSFGMCVQRCSEKSVVRVCTVLAIFFALLLWLNDFAPTQIAKYPPRAYYLAFGMLVSLVLYLLATRLQGRNFKGKELICWLSTNSLSLYFWHIIPVSLFSKQIVTLPCNHFMVRYLVVLALACVGVVMQNKIKVFLKKKDVALGAK